MAIKKKAKQKEDRSKQKEKVAVIWTRVSTKEQAENNNSLETQLRACNEYAEKHKITVIKKYGHTNESAKVEGKLFKKMIADVARTKEVNHILVYSLDRFSRSSDESLLTRQYLKSKGIRVVSVTQPIDHESATGQFMENIIFLFNEFENNLRRDKCIAGMEECLRNGDWFSKPPIGFTKLKNQDKHVIVVNETGQLLRKAFYWKAMEEISDVEIVERLKQRGLKIDRKRLSEIFHNPFYCGKIQHHYLGEDIIKGNQDVLIDEETFNKVNEIETHRNYVHQKITVDFPLKRHVFCSDCGKNMTGYKSKGLPYYKCNTQGCRNNQRADLMHKKYEEKLNSFKVPESLHPMLKKILKKVFFEMNQNQAVVKKDLLKRQTELKTKIEEVTLRYGLGEIPGDVYNLTSSKLKEQLKEVEEGLGKSTENLSNLTNFVDEAIVMVCKLGNIWKNGDFSTCQKVQDLVYQQGVFWQREKKDYLTNSTNNVMKLFDSLSLFCEGGEKEKPDTYEQMSGLVAGAGLEPATFGL